MSDLTDALPAPPPRAEEGWPIILQGCVAALEEAGYRVVRPLPDERIVKIICHTHGGSGRNRGEAALDALRAEGAL